MVRREFIDLFIADMHNSIFIFYLGSNNTCVPLQAPDVGPAQTNDKHSTPDSVAHVIKLLGEATIPKEKN